MRPRLAAALVFASVLLPGALASAQRAHPLPLPARAELTVVPTGGELFRLDLAAPGLPRRAVMHNAVGLPQAIVAARVGDRSFVVWCGSRRSRAVWGLLWITAQGSPDGGMSGMEEELARGEAAPTVVAVDDEALVTFRAGCAYRCYSRHAGEQHHVGCDRVREGAASPPRE